MRGQAVALLPVLDDQRCLAAKVGARLDNQTLQSVPTSRSIFGSATVLPGMVMTRQDPAGLNAATSTGMTAHGASTYNLNYFGVTADQCLCDKGHSAESSATSIRLR